MKVAAITIYAILIYALATAWEVFWIMGAYFFSSENDVMVNSAIFACCCVSAGLFCLWRWPAASVLASLFNLIIKMTWAWPGLYRTDTSYEILVQHGPDVVLFVAASGCLYRRPKIKRAQAVSSSPSLTKKLAHDFSLRVR